MVLRYIPYIHDGPREGVHVLCCDRLENDYEVQVPII